MNPHPEPQSVLIYPPNPLGDCVMAIPAMKALRRRFPQAEVFILLKPSFRPLLDGCEWFDEIIPNPAAETGSSPGAMLAAVRLLRRRSFNLAVIFANSFRSALICRLASAGRRLGYSCEHRGWLLTDPVTPLTEEAGMVPIPMVDYYLRLCAHIGCDTSDRSITLPVAEHAAAAAKTMLLRHGIDPESFLLGIAPGAAYGPSKLWIDRYYGVVTDHFVKHHNAQVLLLSGPGEEAIARRIADAATQRVSIFPGEAVPLDLLKALIKACTLLLTTDSGPRHIGAAVGTPHVAILGPTNPIFSETGTPQGVAVWEKVECAPCQLKECPTDHRCMTRLTPNTVIAALEAILREHGPR